jgi:hypothetical protein
MRREKWARRRDLTGESRERGERQTNRDKRQSTLAGGIRGLYMAASE